MINNHYINTHTTTVGYNSSLVKISEVNLWGSLSNPTSTMNLNSVITN